MSVVQTVDEVQVARATAPRANRELSREMSLGSRGECGTFLVSHMDPLDRFHSTKRVCEAVEGVPHDAIDAFDTGPGQYFSHVICCSRAHRKLLSSRSSSGCADR